MLQLPDPPLSQVMKSGPLKGTPKACIQTCEVLALALRFEKLVLSYNKKGVSDDQRDRLWERMRAIAEKASWMSPRSFEGAAFQIQLAAYLVETAHVSTKIERSDLAHAHRLLYRAMDRVGDIRGFGWEIIRNWLMPVEKDQKKPRRNRRAR